MWLDCVSAALACSKEADADPGATRASAATVVHAAMTEDVTDRRMAVPFVLIGSRPFVPPIVVQHSGGFKSLKWIGPLRA